MATEADFIDVSHYQDETGSTSDDIDWAKVKASGIDAVIIKASEGTSTPDKSYAQNRSGARGAGLAVATYHFLRHGSASAQMQFYLAAAVPLPGERVVVDYEQADVTVEDLVEAVEYLLADGRGLQVTCYGASKLTDDVNGFAGDLSALQATSLWAARYSSAEPVIATKVWPAWSAWQFSQSGKVDGIRGNVDLNRFNGSHDNMLKWFGPAGEPAPGPKPLPPRPERKPTTVAVTSGDPTVVDITSGEGEVVVTLDGKIVVE